MPGDCSLRLQYLPDNPRAPRHARISAGRGADPKSGTPPLYIYIQHFGCVKSATSVSRPGTSTGNLVSGPCPSTVFDDCSVPLEPLPDNHRGRRHVRDLASPVARKLRPGTWRDHRGPCFPLGGAPFSGWASCCSLPDKVERHCVATVTAGRGLCPSCGLDGPTPPLGGWLWPGITGTKRETSCGWLRPTSPWGLGGPLLDRNYREQARQVSAKADTLVGLGISAHWLAPS